MRTKKLLTTLLTLMMLVGMLTGLTLTANAETSTVTVAAGESYTFRASSKYTEVVEKITNNSASDNVLIKGNFGDDGIIGNSETAEISIPAGGSITLYEIANGEVKNEFVYTAAEETVLVQTSWTGYFTLNSGKLQISNGEKFRWENGCFTNNTGETQYYDIDGISCTLTGEQSVTCYCTNELYAKTYKNGTVTVFAPGYSDFTIIPAGKSVEVYDTDGNGVLLSATDEECELKLHCHQDTYLYSTVKYKNMTISKVGYFVKLNFTENGVTFAIPFDKAEINDIEFEPTSTATFSVGADGTFTLTTDGDVWVRLDEDETVTINNYVHEHGVGNGEFYISADANSAYRIISYDSNGGGIYNEEYDYIDNSAIMDSQTCSRYAGFEISENKYSLDRYVFKGWNTEPDGSGTAYRENQTIEWTEHNSNLTLYAQWEKIIPSEAKINSYKYGAAYIDVVVSGNYAVIFADYENGALNKIDIVETYLEAGTDIEIYPIDWEIYIETGDKIMLWNNMTDLVPLCEAYIVE